MFKKTYVYAKLFKEAYEFCPKCKPHRLFHKNREPWFGEEIQTPMFAYFGGIIRKRKGTLIEAGGMEDHVHLLVAMHQTTAVADIFRDIKSGSSRWIHEQNTKYKNFAWQTKYGSFSVSFSMEETVKTYIKNQNEHHQKRSFQDEFRNLLDRHGFEYDERYMWE